MAAVQAADPGPNDAPLPGSVAISATVTDMGQPPYEEISANALALAVELEKLQTPYTPPAAYRERAGANGIMGVGASEYSLLDKVGVLRGTYDMFSLLYPQVQGEIDLRRDPPMPEVPVYRFDGRHELAARRDLALEWLALLDAPHKQRFTFDTGGHAAAFEHAEDVHQILRDVVVPETYPVRPDDG